MAEVNDNSSIQLFEDQKIRTAWDAEKEEWYFFDLQMLLQFLTDQTTARGASNYWAKLKQRLKEERRR